MLQSKRHSLIVFAIFFGNLSFVLLFCFDRWGPHTFVTEGYHSYNGEKILAGAYLLLMLIVAALGLLKTRLWEPFVLFNLSHGSVLVTLLALEFLFALTPSLVPDPIARLSPKLNPILRAIRSEVLEYLPYNPWVKFRPRTAIRDLFADEDMADSWITDDLGFKNDPALVSRSEVTALALGDSFTEAMGVPIDKTWTSLISQSGYPVYNLGVQAYAPQQLVGALEQFGRRFRTGLVIFGYTPGFESRNESLIHAKPGQGQFVYWGGGRAHPELSGRRTIERGQVLPDYECPCRPY